MYIDIYVYWVKPSTCIDVYRCIHIYIHLAEVCSSEVIVREEHSVDKMIYPSIYPSIDIHMYIDVYVYWVKPSAYKDVYIDAY